MTENIFQEPEITWDENFGNSWDTDVTLAESLGIIEDEEKEETE